MQPPTQFPKQLLGQPLGGSSGDWRHRILRFHIPLALASAIVLILWMSFPLLQSIGHQRPAQADPTTGHQGPQLSGTPYAMHQAQDHQSMNPSMNHSGNQIANQDMFQNRLLIARFTTATGYLALGLLGVTLLIGPANLLLHRRTPISSYLARDVGMWAALVSVIHVIAGFFVHGPPAPFIERISFYFFAPDGSPLTNNFGWGNWTGLVATVVVVGLLMISSDAALRQLKAGRWKSLQRLNYALFGLVILHAIFYGALSRVTSIPTLLLGIIVSLVFIGQMVGIRLWRQRHSRQPG